MKQRCIQSVSQAIGRPITVAESRNIETRIKDAMKREAVRDPQAWGALSIGDRMRAGAAAAAKELVQEATLKKVQLGKQIERWDATQSYIADQVAKGFDDDGISSHHRLLVGSKDGKNNVLSVQAKASGIRSTYIAKVESGLEAISPRFMGFIADKANEAAMRRVLHGEKSADPDINKGADAIKTAFSDMVDQMRAAGFDIGKLENYGEPHSWSQQRFIEKGKDSIVETLMPLIDRKVYVHEDGRFYTDAEMRDFLGNAWESVAMNGANKESGSVMGTGGSKLASRQNKSRQIHFMDGDSAAKALNQLSDKNLFESIIGHIDYMANQIALVETFGPNAEHAFTESLDKSYREAVKANPFKEKTLESQKRLAEARFDYLAGYSPPPYVNIIDEAISNLRAGLTGNNVYERPYTAEFSRGLRAWLRATMLGGVRISSIADRGTIMLTSAVNGIPKVKSFLSTVQTMNPLDQNEKALARRHGLMTEVIMADANRFAMDDLSNGLSQKVANVIWSLSTQARSDGAKRRAFSVAMLDTVGHLTRQHADVNAIHADDFRFLVDKGIDQRTWDIWRASDLDEGYGYGQSVLSIENIYRLGGFSAQEKQQAAQTLLSVVMAERDVAILNPGAETYAKIDVVTPGTARGEIAKSVEMFKAFPWAFLVAHYQRGVNGYSGMGKLGYIASFVALQTAFGAIALSIYDIINGRDPRNMNPFQGEHGTAGIIAAFLKGGALGIYGEYLLNEHTADGRSLISTMAGPIFGKLQETDALTRGNIIQSMQGDDPNFGAEMVKWAKGMTPGQNLWYTKAATDHLIFNQMQEFFSPGYLAKAEARAYRNAGTTYWWKPRDAAGENMREPNIENIAGSN